MKHNRPTQWLICGMYLCHGIALLHTIITTIRFVVFITSTSRGASSFYENMFRNCVYIPGGLAVIAGILLLIFFGGRLMKRIEKSRTTDTVVLLCATVLMMPLLLIVQYILIGLSAF